MSPGTATRPPSSRRSGCTSCVSIYTRYIYTRCIYIRGISTRYIYTRCIYTRCIFTRCIYTRYIYTTCIYTVFPDEPVVRALRAEVRVLEGAGATLGCAVTGYPPPRVWWTRAREGRGDVSRVTCIMCHVYNVSRV